MFNEELNNLKISSSIIAEMQIMQYIIQKKKFPLCQMAT